MTEEFKTEESQDSSICRMKSCCSCCMFATVPPYSKEELAALPANIQNSIMNYKENHNENTPCMWLDQQTKLCKHYEDRPDLCKKFVINGPECRKFISIVFKENSP